MRSVNTSIRKSGSNILYPNSCKRQSSTLPEKPLPSFLDRLVHLPQRGLQTNNMSLSERRLASGELVLVTGANGYIASHIVDVLLEEGYTVRGTVRAERPWLNEYFDHKYGQGRFETVIVSSMEIESSFDAAVKGVSGVVHVVSLLLLYKILQAFYYI